MSREDFLKTQNKSGFNAAVDLLSDEIDEIHTYDALIQYAKYLIDEDNIFLALHVLHGLYESSPPDDTYLRYDISMGTLDTISSITSFEDIEDLLA